MAMINLIIKSRTRRMLKSIKKNYQLLIIMVFCCFFVYISAPYFNNIFDMELIEIIPFVCISFSIINLLGNIPRIKFDVAAVPMKICGVLSFRIYTVVRLALPSMFLGLICFIYLPANNTIIHKICTCLMLNILINIHCIMRTQYKEKVAFSNYVLLAISLTIFYFDSFLSAVILVLIYNCVFIFYSAFDYTGLISFCKMFEQLFYGYVNSNSDTLGQTQDIMFNKNKNINLHLMERMYENRLLFLVVYEITRIANRWTQILNQLCAVVVITIFVKEVSINKYVVYFMLFIVLIIGQTMVSYYMQSEQANVNGGFYLIYSIKEKLICKYFVNLVLLFFPMLCFWMVAKINPYNILIYFYLPLQCILQGIMQKKWEKILIAFPFYILLGFAFVM